MATKKKKQRAAAKAAPAPASTGTPFDAIDKDTVEKWLAENLPSNITETQAFIDGDHWQNARGWIGPIPDTGDVDYGTTVDLIERAFTSRNVTNEIVKRHMRGIVGEEPTIGIAPRIPLKAGEKLDDKQQERRLAIESDITEWWDSRNVHVKLQEAVAHACYARRGPLRLYVPSGKLNNGVIPKMADLATALSLIYIEAPKPLVSTVYCDEDTKEEIGILATDINGKRAYELTYLGPDTAAPGQPPDPKNPRQTILRTIAEESDENVPVEFGGRMTMYSIERDEIITPQQNQMQRALNLCLSMIPRNVVTNGFLERMILNALPPGHWETDNRGRKIKFVRENFETGPGTTQWIRGMELPQKDGSVQLTQPSIVTHDPVDTKPADEAKRAIYQDMLEEADQAHVLMTSRATPSGVARIEGRSDFEVSLTMTKAPTNGAGRWIIETVLAMADQFMQTPGTILGEWRAQFECRVNTGPISIDERKQALDEYKQNIISLETAQAKIGVLDVQAEGDRITAENGGVNLGLINRQADIILKLGQAGAAIDGAAELVGINPADAAKLLGADTTVPGDPNANPIPPDPNAPPAPAPPANNGGGKIGGRLGGGPAPAPAPAPSPASQGGGNGNAGA